MHCSKHYLPISICLIYYKPYMSVTCEIYKGRMESQIVKGEIPDTRSFTKIGNPRGHIAFGGKDHPLIQIAIDGYPEAKAVLQPGIIYTHEVPVQVFGIILPAIIGFTINVSWRP